MSQSHCLQISLREREKKTTHNTVQRKKKLNKNYINKQWQHTHNGPFFSSQIT